MMEEAARRIEKEEEAKRADAGREWNTDTRRNAWCHSSPIPLFSPPQSPPPFFHLVSFVRDVLLGWRRWWRWRKERQKGTGTILVL